MKRNNRITDTITSTPAIRKGSFRSVLPMSGRSMERSMSLASPTVPMIAPSPPMVLMTPLASDRYSPGIVSGMSATTGPRPDCLNTFSMNRMMIRRASPFAAAKGIEAKKSAESGNVTRMKGILRPIGVLVRSEIAATMGIRKRAKMLSRVITAPMTLFKEMKSRRNIGTYAS